uniref:Uncharacterized protein n=1 Tax=Sphaerodactylus townsendi TaxID=933632 RepID=A0ACB8EDQ7_9SAUR
MLRSGTSALQETLSALILLPTNCYLSAMGKWCMAKGLEPQLGVLVRLSYGTLVKLMGSEQTGIMDPTSHPILSCDLMLKGLAKELPFLGGMRWKTRDMLGRLFWIRDPTSQQVRLPVCLAQIIDSGSPDRKSTFSNTCSWTCLQPAAARTESPMQGGCPTTE